MLSVCHLHPLNAHGGKAPLSRNLPLRKHAVETGWRLALGMVHISPVNREAVHRG